MYTESIKCCDSILPALPARVYNNVEMIENPCPGSPIEPIDSACMRQTAEGDTSAFKNIVDRWQTRLINFFYRTVGNRADAEDLCQETFVHLHRAASRYEARDSFSAYLFTLARRRLIDFQRRRIRRPLDFIDPTDWPMQQQVAPDDESGAIEKAFHLALQALPPKQSHAILLLQQQNLSYEEIAQTMQISTASVKTNIHRARTHLRQSLKDFRHLL